MNISWSSDDYSYDAEITKCVMANNKINIVFQGIDDGDIFEGRISLDATNYEQTQQAFWIYPDSKKEKARFAETQLESEEESFKAIVTGKLHNFMGERVEFIGKWDETGSNQEDGESWDFELEAQIDG